MDKIDKKPYLSDLKIVKNSKGDILHALKASDDSFLNFGEAYFSEINYSEIKGWKRHTTATLNIIVPIGKIRFIIFDKNAAINIMEVSLSLQNFKRLTIPPGYWVAFKGEADSQNILINISDIEHDPFEAENKKLNEIQYNW